MQNKLLGELYTKQDWENMAITIYLSIEENCPDDDITNALSWSFAHIVWEDGNYRPEDIQWCLDEYAANEDKYLSEYSEEALKWTELSLKLLQQLPEYKQEWWEV